MMGGKQSPQQSRHGEKIARIQEACENGQMWTDLRGGSSRNERQAGWQVQMRVSKSQS